MAILLIVNLSCCCCRNCKCVLIDSFVDLTTSNVFGNILEKQKDGVNNEQVTTVFGFKASRLFMYWLFTYYIYLSGFVFLVFWDNFLLEESSDCNPNDTGLTCFSSNASRSDLSLDCSDTHYLEANNITSFTCFKFAFNIGRASGSAYGIVIFAKNVLCPILWIILKFSNGKTGNRCQKVCVVLVQLVLLSAGYGFVYIFFLAAPSTFIKLLKSYKYSAFKAAATYLTLVYCTFTPWLTLEKIENNNNNKDSSNEALLQNEGTRRNSIEMKCIPPR